MGKLLGAALIGLALAIPRVASAAPSAVALHWSAPEGCPGEEYVRDSIDAILRGGGSAATPISVDAHVEVDDDGHFRVVMKTKQNDVAGERTIDAVSCKQAADATALVLAMLVDPSRAKENEPPPPPPPEPAPPSPPASSSGRASDRGPVEPEGPPPPPKRFSIGLNAIVDSASLPEVAFGGGARAGIRIAPMRIVGSFVYYAQTEAQAANDPLRGGRLRLATAGVHGELPFGSTVEIAPLAGLELGSMTGAGYGVRRPTNGSMFWSAIRFGLAVRWPARDLVSLHATLEGAVPLQRDRFILDGDFIHRSAPISVRGTVGAELNF